MKGKERSNPILAICYDFDKTLSPTDMQAQGYIQSIDYDVDAFWKKSNSLAEENKMDQNLAYMYMMAKGSRGKVIFNRHTLKEFGSKVTLFPGVDSWFDRINTYGESNGVSVEHYIISSGLKEMIEGTSIADKFKKIYASSFYYDEDGVAVWPAQVVNYTDKTQYLFRIEKGILNVNDQGVNSYYSPDKLRIPFRNIVYIGDSDTDIPCMKLVNVNGGHSIGVYNSETKDKSKVFRMLDENRIKYFEPADYTEGSSLEKLIMSIIDRTKTNESLERIHYDCVNEKDSETYGQSERAKKKQALIDRLDESSSFSNTHAVIKELEKITDWTDEEKIELLRIGIKNNQVKLILTDDDVKSFYLKICNIKDDYAVQINNIINQGS